MSQEDVEVVRAAFGAWNGGPLALADVVDPDVDWRAIEGAPDDVGPMHGLAALQAYTRDSAATPTIAVAPLSRPGFPDCRPTCK